MLDWATGSENNHNLFLIQRSDNGIDFYTLGKVEGKGMPNKESHYQFLDVLTSDKKIFYRLQEVEHSGKTILTS